MGAARWHALRRRIRATQRRARRRTPPPRYLSRVPSGRNLAERQVDNLCRNAIFTYGQLVARLRLPPHDRQRDRAVRRGHAEAAHRADLLLAQAQGVSGRHRAGEAEAAQAPVRAPAVVEAGDGLLADVAALGEADGGVDDAGLGGHRRRAHLGAEAGPAALDADDLD